MTRRNLLLILAVALASYACYQQVQKNVYGRVLSVALDQIDRRYLTEVDRRKLFEAAMQGMVAELNDPNSNYFTPSTYKQFNAELDGQFVGVGIQLFVDPEMKQLVVEQPLFDSPAEAAGVQAGDVILAIDGQSAKGFGVPQAAARIKGEAGTPVVLTVLHRDAKEPVDLTITRATISVESVRGDTRNADGSWNFYLRDDARIGYIRVLSFSEKTAEELLAALKTLPPDHLQALIFDLRNNPGGYLEKVVQMCDLFIDGGEIVSTRGRNPSDVRVFSATGRGTYLDFPIVVLVNGQSASASEIMAACLQDHQRAIVVGERSYGKGTVQDLIPLEAGHSGLKITTRRYTRPSGKNIHRFETSTPDDDWGVLPTEGFTVPLTDEQHDQLWKNRRQRDLAKPGDASAVPAADDVDPQLKKAIEYLRQKVGEAGRRKS